MRFWDWWNYLKTGGEVVFPLFLILSFFGLIGLSLLLWQVGQYLYYRDERTKANLKLSFVITIPTDICLIAALVIKAMFL